MICIRCPCCLTPLFLPDSCLGGEFRCPLSGARHRLPAVLPRFCEAQWLGEGDLARHLAFVRIECCSDRRKQGLLLCGMCRLAGDHLPAGILYRAVDLGERLAEGRLSEREYLRRCSGLEEQLRPLTVGDDLLRSAWASTVYRCLTVNPTFSRASAPLTAHPEAAIARHLLHDLFGNPFRPAPLDLAWLAWHDGLIDRMAALIHKESRFEDLPVLADALEDAGCTDTEILAHCRSAGPHYRGCWVLSHLLFPRS